jgi:hypothetical protein
MLTGLIWLRIGSSGRLLWKTVMNVSQKCRNFLISWATISFSENDFAPRSELQD